MFLIMLNYKKPIEIVEQFVTAHRAYLDEGYQKNCFITSGPRNPRSGGIILSQMKDRDALDKILKADPFYVNGIADFEVIEFVPNKFHKDFLSFAE